MQKVIDLVTARHQTVLITGASGFVAAHVVRAFLEKGYNVKSTVRSTSTAEKVLQSHPQYSEQLSFAIVEDIAAQGAFDEAVKDVHGVIHTASPFVFDVQDFEKDLLLPAIQGTVGLLKSVQKFNSSVKRVVITSSFAAMVDLSKGLWPDHTCTEADWNPDDYTKAKGGPGPLAYCASKKLAEKAAFEYVTDHKPNFCISTILPPMIYGPLLHSVTDMSKLNTSSADLYRLINGSSTEVPETSFPAFVDVRDVAQAHLRAYEKSEAVGQRYFVTGGNFTYQQVCDVIRRRFPDLTDKTPAGVAGQVPPLMFKTDVSKAQRDLGMTFRGLEEVVVETVTDLLRLQKALGAPSGVAQTSTSNESRTKEQATKKTEEASRAAKVDDKKAVNRENASAIPTAGGQKVGEQHFGESKTVID